MHILSASDTKSTHTVASIGHQDNLQHHFIIKDLKTTQTTAVIEGQITVLFHNWRYQDN